VLANKLWWYLEATFRDEGFWLSDARLQLVEQGDALVVLLRPSRG